MALLKGRKAIDAEIARRIYGPDCGDGFTIAPAKAAKAWPDCLQKDDAARLEPHEQAIARASGPLLQRLLLKLAQPKDGGNNKSDPQKMMMLTKAQKVFGFKTPKEFTCFLDRHPEVGQDKPLTKKGEPNQRRRNEFRWYGGKRNEFRSTNANEMNSAGAEHAMFGP